MIKIDRHKFTKPPFFKSKEYERLHNEIHEFYGLNKKIRAQRTYSVGYFPDEVVNPLMDLFEHKCGFCESNLRNLKSGYGSYVKHFRPTSYTQGFDSKDIDEDHYWWLSYEWNNLYAICSTCQRFKSNVFPVEGKRAAIKTPHSEINRKESAYLIDPCEEDPSQFFDFDLEKYEIIPKKVDSYPSFLLASDEFSKQIEANTERARATIQILGLNRSDLIADRQSIANQMQQEVELLRKNADNIQYIAFDWSEILQGNSIKNHIAFRCALINYYFEDKEIQNTIYRLTDLGQSAYNQQIQQQQQQQMQMPPTPEAQEQSRGNMFEAMQFPLEETEKGYSRAKNEAPKVKKAVFQKRDNEYYAKILKNVYLDKIVLRNFKCFSDLTLHIPSYANDTSVEPWLVFLGENGVGKSSVLKAIAMALMGKVYLDQLDITVKDVLKYGKQSGFIEVYGKDHDEVYRVDFNKKKNTIECSIDEPPAFIIGYGSTRLLPIGKLEPEKDHPSYLKIKNLFDSSISLSNAKDWLLESKLKTFNEVSRTLKNLLLLNDLDSIRRSPKKKEIYIKYHHSGDIINIDHLSDGYKSIFAVAIDMIYTLSQENIAYELAEGIVLIDEIGTHLHPRWKMEIVDRLRNTFPKIQFLITTHEPLCLRGLKENEVVVLKRDEENAIIALSDLPDPSALRIDQLLTSEYFGLNSTMDIKTELLFNEYYKLLAIDKIDRTEKEQVRLEELQEEVNELKYMRFGNDKREEIIYQVVDELLAKNMRKKDLKIDIKDIKQEAIDRVKSLWKKLDQKK